jgi:hypothetical protein
MSDPLNRDPYRNDQPLGYDVQRLWPWLTAALVLGLLIGGLIGFDRGVDYERRIQSNPPTTTGSAPSQRRPAPETR